MFKRLCFIVLLIIIFSISVLSSEELVFDSQMIRIEKLGEEQVLGDPVEISILNDDGSSYSKSAKINISLGYTDGQVFDYKGLKYIPGDKSQVRFPFGILKKYDIIYLKALLEDGNTIETFYNIPVLKETKMKESKGITEGKVKWYFDDSEWEIHDCTMKRGGLFGINFAFTTGYGYGAETITSIAVMAIDFGEFGDDIDIINVENITVTGNESIWNTQFKENGDYTYFRIAAELTAYNLNDNLPDSWKYYYSSYCESEYVNATQMFKSEMFSDYSMVKNASCWCCWQGGAWSSVNDQKCGAYKLIKKSGDKGYSFIMMWNNFALAGDNYAYWNVYEEESKKLMKCNPPSSDLHQWDTAEIKRERYYIVKGPGIDKTYDYSDNYITDIGIIHRESKNQTIVFGVNNGLLYWSLQEEPLTQLGSYKFLYDCNYLKVNDNEILVLPKSMDKWNRNQKGLRITFKEPEEETESKLATRGEDILIEEIDLPINNFGRYDFTEYIYKINKNGKVYFLELYKYYSGGYKTKFYLGEYDGVNNEKKEIGSVGFNTFADFDFDYEGNIWLIYKTDCIPIGRQENVGIELREIEVDQEEEIPVLKVKSIDFLNNHPMIKLVDSGQIGVAKYYLPDHGIEYINENNHIDSFPVALTRSTFEKGKYCEIKVKFEIPENCKTENIWIKIKGFEEDNEKFIFLPKENPNEPFNIKGIDFLEIEFKSNIPLPEHIYMYKSLRLCFEYGIGSKKNIRWKKGENINQIVYIIYSNPLIYQESLLIIVKIDGKDRKFDINGIYNEPFDKYYELGCKYAIGENNINKVVVSIFSNLSQDNKYKYVFPYIGNFDKLDFVYHGGYGICGYLSQFLLKPIIELQGINCYQVEIASEVRNDLSENHIIYSIDPKYGKIPNLYETLPLKAKGDTVYKKWIFPNHAFIYYLDYDLIIDPTFSWMSGWQTPKKTICDYENNIMKYLGLGKKFEINQYSWKYKMYEDRKWLNNINKTNSRIKISN